MATPHVAGVLAAMISRDGNGTPAEMQKKLKSECLKDKLNLDVAGMYYLTYIPLETDYSISASIQ